MTAAEPVPATFDRWAASYDAEINPFLSLERRILESLLPPLHGLRLLDAGCGSGRHFPLFAERGVSAIHAVDFSPAMLALAELDQPDCVQLHCAPCDAVPLEDASIDIAVCSLVLGYLPSLEAFFEEMRRVLRSSGCLVITDIHPDTALRLQWQRSFSADGTPQAIRWNQCKLDEVFEKARRAGFHITCDFSLPFAAPERDLFAEAGREPQFEQLQSEPSLYALVLRTAAPAANIALLSARCGLSAHDAHATEISISDDRITALTSGTSSASTIDLSGYLLLPGLINAHDHLEFGLFPQIFAGPYRDAAQWAADIHHRFAEVIAAHRAISRRTRIRFGALRNLVCGVTTVCHHNPIDAAMLDPSFPVSIVDAFRWAHSPTFDRSGLQQEAALESPQLPFILHAGEGTSPDAIAELRELQELGLLRPSTVLVHGVAADINFLQECRAQQVGFIACPSSNHNLFAATPAAKLLHDYPFIALGSDSPLTACGDLLDEARFTAGYYQLQSSRLYDLLTKSAARLLQLRKGEGNIALGAFADLIAVPDRSLSPADTLRTLSWQDVHLVMRRGQVWSVSAELRPRVSTSLLNGFTEVKVDGPSRWLRGDWRDDFLQAAPVSQNGALMLGQRRISLA